MFLPCIVCFNAHTCLSLLRILLLLQWTKIYFKIEFALIPHAIPDRCMHAGILSCKVAIYSHLCFYLNLICVLHFICAFPPIPSTSGAITFYLYFIFSFAGDQKSRGFDRHTGLRWATEEGTLHREVHYLGNSLVPMWCIKWWFPKTSTFIKYCTS